MSDGACEISALAASNVVLFSVVTDAEVYRGGMFSGAPEAAIIVIHVSDVRFQPYQPAGIEVIKERG
ncbi:hypothetical protein [Agrobacterium pusense]|uniref:hypothetical protein n=1 Tax=Agrobacterium pusense TaxID=648995 RepID=UPI001C6E992B|nr:hypothetical protein [Agrobacterium pusense]MBW9069831.1 hypothetical protein [Agrobacterium pusense]MBW9084930.1 hypothetical protein [Agrobacterium pusense]MBW9125595.1 hypothetical protein [Agrobacterium pusense]MBW9138010.1 hypothetical protein [Agrobacterium pusense]